MALETARRLWAWLRAPFVLQGPELSAALRQVSRTAVFSAPGTCATCIQNAEHRAAETRAAASQPVCRLRGFAIVAPDTTCCKNYTATCTGKPQDTPLGAICSIQPGRGRACLPWVGLIAPHEAAGTCMMCGRATENGIRIDLLEGPVFACTARHYYAWWSAYLKARLGFFREGGERAYAEMCEALSPSIAKGHFGNAQDAFRRAIGTARDLEQAEEQAALQARLEQVESTFRSKYP